VPRGADTPKGMSLVLDPIASGRAGVASYAVPEAPSVAGRAPSPGRGVPVPCNGGRDGSLPLTGNGRIGRGSCARPGLGALIDVSESRSADSCLSFPVLLRGPAPRFGGHGVAAPSTRIPPFNRP